MGMVCTLAGDDLPVKGCRCLGSVVENEVLSGGFGGSAGTNGLGLEGTKGFGTLLNPGPIAGFCAWNLRAVMGSGGADELRAFRGNSAASMASICGLVRLR